MASQPRPAGYSALIERHALVVLPNWHASAVARGNTHRVETAGPRTFELYPARYWPGEGLGSQLEFALKYDGVNLEVLAALFEAIDPEELRRYVLSRPTGSYARRLWYLHELLTARQLDIPDVKQGNYVDLLDPRKYHTSVPQRVRRQRVRDNLLGDARFCPIVRRTERLEGLEQTDLAARCAEVLGEYPADLLRRALSYLYLKETRSSFEIERVTPSRSRAERFVSALRQAEEHDFLERSALVGLQNRIVDERYRNADYRTSQIFVGSTAISGYEIVHFIAPKPADLPELMEGMIACHARMEESGLQPVVHAAVTAFGFVFAHPFDDGNGRIHRFLIHNVLARRGLTPRGMVFPVSATMLRQRVAYDEALEAFSKPLMGLLEYDFDEESRLVVHGETARHYRYIDLTPQVEALFGFVEETIETDLVEELEFLRSYDEAKRAMQEIVDMPDRRIDLFIRFCRQNRGTLSRRKRESRFPELTDLEVEDLEAAVRASFGLG